MNEKNESLSVEERVRDALLTRAALVTDETLRLPDELPGPHGRGMWPILAAVAAVLAVVAGVAIVVAAVPIGDIEPAHPKSSAAIQTPTPPSDPAPRCADETRCLIQSVAVNRETLDLYGAVASDVGDGWYEGWTLEMHNGTEIGRGGVVDSATENGKAPEISGHINAYVRVDSLACEPGGNGDPAVCLLQTWDVGDTFDAYLLARTSSGWFFELRFSLPLTARSAALSTIGGATYVVSIQEEPLNPGVWAHVWQLDGKALGCTARVDRMADLPGWPEVTPDLDTLTTECEGMSVEDGAR